MSKEVVVLTADDILKPGVLSISDKDLPEMLQGQIHKLNELDKSVKEAMEAAEHAKDSAASAREKSAGFGKKKGAIEELQSAEMELATAVQMGAEAQKVSFEFQTKLAEISKYLFALGVSDLARNRFVVRELEMKLKGASKAELTELARQELISVIKQLKEQEDILRKQENLAKIIKYHEEKLKNQSQRIYEIDERLKEQLKAQSELVTLHSEQLQSHAEINKSHSEQLEDQAEFTKIQAEQIKIQSENIKIQEEQLVILHEMSCDLTVQLNHASLTIESQEMNINALKDELNRLEILLDSKTNNKFSKINLVIASIACIVSVIHFF